MILQYHVKSHCQLWPGITSNKFSPSVAKNNWSKSTHPYLPLHHLVLQPPSAPIPIFLTLIGQHMNVQSSIVKYWSNSISLRWFILLFRYIWQQRFSILENSLIFMHWRQFIFLGLFFQRWGSSSTTINPDDGERYPSSLCITSSPVASEIILNDDISLNADDFNVEHIPKVPVRLMLPHHSEVAFPGCIPHPHHLSRLI